MIGTLRENQRKATIIGAGISGLLIAAMLKRRGFRVSVFEASSRAGGLIRTRTTPYGMAETAAHSLMVNDEVRAFLDEIGVELLPVRKESRARYIFRKGRMRRMPLTFSELITTLIRFCSKPLTAFDPVTGSLGDWTRAYLGEPALRYLLTPFVTGVYAASPDELNLSIAFPALLPKDPSRSLFWNLFLAPKHKKGASQRPRMMAPVGGMETLVHRLVAELGEDLRLSSPIETLPEDSNLILSIPPAELSQLIHGEDPVSAKHLNHIRHAPLITVTLFAPRTAFAEAGPTGVGVLIPRGEGLRILGVLFNSSSFTGRTQAPETLSLTIMLGGTQDPEALALSDPQITDLITRELNTLLGLQGPVHHLEITRWERAIPVFSHELVAARKALSDGFFNTPGRMLFTNYSGEVSIRGMINAARHNFSGK